MEKIKILLFALFVSFTAIGQQYTPMTAAGYQMKRIKSDSTLHIPSFCGVPTLRNSTAKEGALAMDTCAGLLYMWTRANGWDTVNTSGGGGSTDTTSLSNRIDAKLSKSDSSIYYTKFRSDSSRTNIYTAIGGKLNTSDSSIYYTKFRSDTSRDNIYAAIYSATTGDTAVVVKAFVTNAESTTLTRGEVVYLYQASGNRASVKRANNKSDGTSAKTFGIVRDDIGANQTGYIVTQGQCDKLNLGVYPEGSTLYLDSISGQMTVTKPKAPYHLVYVGIVERANNGNGILYVKPQNGYELDEIHDVQINSPLNNQIIAYSDTQNIWKNRNIYSVVDTTQLSNRINTKLNSSDSTIYQTKFRSDSARTNTYTAIASKIGASDTSVFQRKSLSAYSFMANNTNASANATAFTFKEVASQTLSGGITWAGTAPSGTTNHQYRWCQIGNLVTFYATLIYGTAGVSNTQLTLILPSDLPTPYSPPGLTTGASMLYYGVANIAASTSTVITSSRQCMLRRNSANTGYEIIVTQSAVIGVTFASITIQYLTN